MGNLFIWSFIIAITGLTLTKCQTSSKSTQTETNVTLKHNCNFILSNNTKEELESIRQDLIDDKYEIIRLTFDVLIYNPTIPDSLIKKRTYQWVIVTETGVNLLKHTQEYDAASLKRNKITEKGTSVTARFDQSKCDLHESQVVFDLATDTVIDAVKSVQDVSGICYRFTDDDGPNMVKIGHPKLKCLTAQCNFTKSDSCSFIIGQSFLGFFATVWTYFIILYSPILVYWLYDGLNLKDDNHLFYKMKETPYSFKRLLIILSYYSICWFPCKRTNFINARPIFRTGLLLWGVTVAITVRNALYYQSTSDHRLFNIEIQFLPKDMSIEIQSVIYSVVLVIFIFLLLGLLYSCGYEVPRKISKDPLVYCWCSTGSIKSLSIKKKQISDFTKHKASDLNEGQWFALQHAERFTLLASVKFWKWVLKESFSMLIKKRRTTMTKLLFIPLGFVVGCLYAIFSVVLNLLWGLFPLFGIFFSFISSVSSWFSLFRVLIVTFVMMIFIQILVTNSVLFVLNFFIYTLYSVLPSEGGKDTGSESTHILLVIGYGMLYWHQFSSQYKTLLAIIFEVENENINEQSQIEDFEIDSKMSPPQEIVTKISIRKFSFISDYCSPVRKRMIALLIKVILTATFLLVGVTIVSIKSDVVILSNATSVFTRFAFFVLPVVIQYLYTRSKSHGSDDSEILKEKVSFIIKEWKEPGAEEEADNEENADDSADVECAWITNLCYGRKKNVQNNQSPPSPKELSDINDQTKQRPSDGTDTPETSLYTEL